MPSSAGADLTSFFYRSVLWKVKFCADSAIVKIPLIKISFPQRFAFKATHNTSMNEKQWGAIFSFAKFIIIKTTVFVLLCNRRSSLTHLNINWITECSQWLLIPQTNNALLSALSIKNMLRNVPFSPWLTSNRLAAKTPVQTDKCS